MSTTIKLCSNHNVRYGEFSVEVLQNEAEMEEEQYDLDVENDRKSSDDGHHLTVDETTLEYCEHCFLSFGSQERRVVKNGKVVHATCATYVN